VSVVVVSIVCLWGWVCVFGVCGVSVSSVCVLCTCVVPLVCVSV
jgi:hypothetical protein